MLKRRRVTVFELIEELRRIGYPDLEIVLFNSRGEEEAPRITAVMDSKKSPAKHKPVRIQLTAESDD